MHRFRGSIEALTQRTFAAQTPQAPARSDTSVVSGLQTDSVRFKTLTSAFYQNAKHLRSKIAVWDFSEDVEGTAISYQLLAAWAGVVSGRLLRSGVKRGRRIPFLAQRGVEFIVGIIAALSCGAQIVAVDCRRPLTEVRTAMAGSGEVDVVLSVSRAEDSLHEETLPKGVHVVRIHSRDMQTIDATTPLEFSNSAEANDACYSVFTSGGPSGKYGTAKEVRVKHKTLTNLVCQRPGDLGVKAGVAVGHLQPVESDTAMWEVFCCLCNGGTLVIGGVQPENAMRKVEVLIATPTMLASWRPDQFPELKTVAAAGEPVSQCLADTWAAPGREFWYCYGSSETTLVSSMSDYTCKSDAGPIVCGASAHSSGCPTLTNSDPMALIKAAIPNCHIKVVSEAGNNLPTGFAGSIWVGGLGVSNELVGYGSESCASTQALQNGHHLYLYRTGDQGFPVPEGGIQICGEGNYARSAADELSRIEIQSLTSSLACAAGTPDVAVVISGWTVYCFIADQGFVQSRRVSEGTSGAHKDAEEARRDMELISSVEDHWEILRGRGDIHQESYIDMICRLPAIPVGWDGKLDRDALRDVVRNELQARLGMGRSSNKTKSSLSF